MKYYKIENNEFKGFYDSKVHSNLELTKDNGYYEVSDEKWMELIEHQNIKYKDGELISSINTRDDDISEGIITLESERKKARNTRSIEFRALDILDSKVAVGRDDLTLEEQEEINNWYQTWLEIPNNYKDISNPIEGDYPIMPERVQYYKNKEI